MLYQNDQFSDHVNDILDDGFVYCIPTEDLNKRSLLNSITGYIHYENLNLISIDVFPILGFHFAHFSVNIKCPFLIEYRLYSERIESFSRVCRLVMVVVL